MAGGRARVAVSILDADHSNMAHAIRRAESEGADRFHVDVMDGHFVPNLTFGPKMIKGIRPRTELPLDAHLMITDPARYVDEFLEAGCDSITFHVEVDPEQIAPTLEAIRAAGRAAGSRGQARDAAVGPRAVPAAARHRPRDDGRARVRWPVVHARRCGREAARGPRVPRPTSPVGGEVHVDGGVNRETAEFVGGLGVDILVVGSVLWIKGRDMGREIRLVRALADEGYQYRLNDGKPPIPRDAMVTFAQLPRHLAWRFMAEIERGGIPVIPLRGNGRFNPDGMRDFDLLVPASAETLTEERHAADRERYLEEAERWRVAYAAEHGVKPPERPRPGTGAGEVIPPEVDPARPSRA